MTVVISERESLVDVGTALLHSISLSSHYLGLCPVWQFSIASQSPLEGWLGCWLRL